MVKRILVSLGGTPFSYVAIERALDLAKRHEAKIIALSVANLKQLQNVGPVPIGAGSSAERIRKKRLHETCENIEKALSHFRSRCLENNVPYEAKYFSGSPAKAIASFSRYCDLAVFGFRGLFDYGVLNNPDRTVNQIITSGVRPFITVSEKFRSIERVVIAYNGSLEAAAAMRLFVQMRLWDEVQLLILCFGSSSVKGEETLRDAAEYCSAFGYEPETRFVSGSGKSRLLETAMEWNADMVVLGDSARSLLVEKVFGSTSYSVLRSATIPLFMSH